MVYNPYIAVPLAVWVIAQLIKFIVAAFSGRLDFRYLYASGGMPSVHSAVVCALAATAFLVDGVESHLFGLAAIFAAVVMYDSFGVRRSSGEQAEALNALIDSLGNDRHGNKPHPKRLRELLGHKPGEVTVGALLGVFLACLFNIDKLTSQLNWLATVPGKREFMVYLSVFGVIVVAGAAVSGWLRWRYKSSEALRKVSRKVLVLTQTIGWIGLVLVFFQYERTSYLGWRVWPLLVLLVGLVWGGLSAWRNIPVLRSDLEREKDRARRNKWFHFGRKKRAKKK